MPTVETACHTIPASVAVLGTRAVTSKAARSTFVAELFEAYGPRVYRRALRMLGNVADAEEATQEIFVRVMRAVQGGGEAPQLSTTWLHVITTNYCLNLLRDRKRRHGIHEAYLAPTAARRDEAGPARSDDLAAVRSLLAKADPQQAQAAVYVYLDGLSHDEAAELLGVSRRTVGNQLDRFRAWAQQQAA